MQTVMYALSIGVDWVSKTIYKHDKHVIKSIKYPQLFDKLNERNIFHHLANYDYPKAATDHSKMVTESFVRFMNFLVQRGMDVQKTSIAGHSLGAQIAGLIGHKFGGKLEAIYGIDPAGPGFTIPKGIYIYIIA